MALHEDFIQHLKNIFLPSQIIMEGEDLTTYGRDQTEDLFFLPEIVVKPKNVDEISAVLRLCNDFRVPVTVRGAGTGLAGGALPVHKGLVLSMEKFNNILNIDEENFCDNARFGRNL